MAVEDFTTYTEVDASTNITVTSTSVTAVACLGNEDNYVYADKGAAHFTGDFSHDFEFTLNENTKDLHDIAWALSNTVDDSQYWTDTSNDAIAVIPQYKATNVIRLYIWDYWSGSSQKVDISHTWNSKVWYRMARSGTNLTIAAFSNSARTNLLGSKTLSEGTAHNYQYVFAWNHNNTGSSGVQTGGITENLDLGEAGADTVTLGSPAALAGSVPSPSGTSAGTVGITTTSLAGSVPSPSGVSTGTVALATPASMPSSVPNVSLAHATTITLAAPAALASSVPSVAMTSDGTLVIDATTLASSVPTLALTSAGVIVIDETSLISSVPADSLASSGVVVIDESGLVSVVPNVSLVEFAGGDLITLMPATMASSVPAVGLTSSGAVVIDPAVMPGSVPSPTAVSAGTVGLGTPAAMASSAPAVALTSTGIVVLNPAVAAMSVPNVSLSQATTIVLTPATIASQVPAIAAASSGIITIDPTAMPASVPAMVLTSTGTILIDPAELASSVPLVSLTEAALFVDVLTGDVTIWRILTDEAAISRILSAKGKL